MLKLGSLAPELSIQTDYGWFSLTEQIGKKVVIFFPHALIQPGVSKKPNNFLQSLMHLPRKTLS